MIVADNAAFITVIKEETYSYTLTVELWEAGAENNGSGRQKYQKKCI